MNFELSEDQQLLKKMVKEFAQKEIAPKAHLFEDKHEFPRELLAKLAELGILGMTVPAEYGGTKTNFLSLIIALEEISCISASLSVIVSVHCSLFCYAIQKFGSEMQKKKISSKSGKR